MSCFLLLRACLDLEVLVFVECLVVCSCVPISTFSLTGCSGGESGHGVRFDGTVISKGGSIIHLHEITSNGQLHPSKHIIEILRRYESMINLVDDPLQLQV